MRSQKPQFTRWVLAFVVMSVIVPTGAQSQTPSSPGSPAASANEGRATESMDRSHLPMPNTIRPGLVTYDAKDPDTKFPPIGQLRPPEGAPNVLIVLIDDAGFGASSAFGGMGRLSENTVLNLKNKSHSITAEIEVPTSGAQGVIAAQAAVHK